MCTNKQIENNVHKSWKKEHFLGSFLACGIICVCLFYHDGPLFLGINATLESSCAVFLFGGAICTELLWINDLHEQYSEIKKKKQEYVTEIVREIAGVNNSQMVQRAVFIAQKAEHEHSAIPLIIAVGSLCVSVLTAINGDCITLPVVIILSLLVFGFSEQKRLHAIEDAVKDYAFKEVIKETEAAK